jgi:hypothetical protein
MSTSHLCALAGDLAVNQVLRHVLGLGASVADREVEWNGFTMKTRVSPLERKPRCPADHVVWRSCRAETPVGDHTLRDVARAAGLRDPDRAAFRVGETLFVQRGICHLGHGQAVERFVAAGRPAGTCASCGAPLASEPFFERDAAPSRLLVTQLDRPIRELCAEPPGFVLVSENGSSVLFRAAPARGGEG